MDTERVVLTLKLVFLTCLDLQNIFFTQRANRHSLMFQMVKFSIIVKQITGTQAWLPENPTDHGQKPLFTWKSTAKDGGARSDSPAVSATKLPLPLRTVVCLIHVASSHRCPARELLPLGGRTSGPELAGKVPGTSCHDQQHPRAQPAADR